MFDNLMPNFKLPAVIIACITALFFLGACQGVKPTTVELPDETRLRARMQEFHNALGNNDIAAWYAMTSPTIRDKMTFDQFKKDLRWDEDASRRTRKTTRADLMKPCSCVQMQFIRCVVIADITIEEPGKNPSRERPLEMWEFADGEWYCGVSWGTIREAVAPVIDKFSFKQTLS
jgi:hypothetical protein